MLEGMPLLFPTLIFTPAPLTKNKEPTIFYTPTALGIVPFLNGSKPKARHGKFFLVNASQVFEKGVPQELYPRSGIPRLADTPSEWNEEVKLSRIVEHDELKKNDYYIHTSDIETYRSIAKIVDELKIIDVEASQAAKAFPQILKQPGV